MASRVRITVQLVRVRDQTYIWSHSYDGELSDYLDVQRDIAEQVAGEIRVKLAPGRRSIPRPVNPEAYEAYLKGRYYMSKRTEAGFEKAIGYFHEAIEKEPDYALAYAGLGDVYQILEQVDDARIAVAKSVQLDDQLPDAHNSLGRLLYRVDHDWSGAEREFKRALALDANDYWYYIYLALSSRKPESLTEAQKAYELDPMSPIIRVHLASRLQAVGKYEKAIELLQRTIEITPDFPTLHSVWGGIYEEKGMFPEAIVEYEKALQLGGPGEELRGFVGYLYAVAGNRKEAGRVLENLKRAWPKKTHAALDIALVYAGLADKERALYWLQRANEAKVSDLSDLGQDPHFRRLHGDPRFETLVQQVGPPVR